MTRIPRPNLFTTRIDWISLWILSKLYTCLSCLSCVVGVLAWPGSGKEATRSHGPFLLKAQLLQPSTTPSVAIVSYSFWLRICQYLFQYSARYVSLAVVQCIHRPRLRMLTARTSVSLTGSHRVEQSEEANNLTCYEHYVSYCHV